MKILRKLKLALCSTLCLLTKSGSSKQPRTNSKRKQIFTTTNLFLFPLTIGAHGKYLSNKQKVKSPFISTLNFQLVFLSAFTYHGRGG